jgi:osmotically-inducible protein OsmY
MKRLITLTFIASLLLLQGCVSTLTKGADRRTEGAYVEDSSIENTAVDRIKKKYQDKVHINVNSYNRKVLVTGEVPDEATKLDITRIVGTVQNVSDIYNELVVALFQSTLSSRSNDLLITSNVKFRLQQKGSKEFRADLITVVTEDKSVYLLGLVTHDEAKIATEVASTSKGVKKVVPYFEYID